ncbi:MAG: FG-GAP repeat domain-containing protein [Candidatus Hermodarchaeia archaeon]
MKRRNLAIALFMGLLIFTSITITQSKRPPKATLSVEITAPSDGIIIENEGSFTVSGNILCQNGDAGTVDSYIQYSNGEGSNNFNTIDGSNFQIIVGDHPQSQNLLQDESYSVSWELKGSPGIYEIRIISEAKFAKSGSSESRTVTIEGPSPPPDIETIDNEYQDTAIGYGSASGTYVSTYFADGIYLILSEEKNTHGTKKPVDDTTEIGWIFVFEDLQERQNTMLTIFGHANFPSDDTDDRFIFQLLSGDSWIPILEFRNVDVDRSFSADIPDDTSTTIVLRVVDNDQTIGNKIISSLLLDQVYISYDQTNEFNIADFDGKIGYRGVKIGDVDNDDENEVAVLLNTPEDIGQIRVYEYHSGIWDEEIIVENSVWGWELAIGDVDNDLLNEIVVAFVYDSQGYELKYYEFDGTNWTEHNIANPDGTTLAVAIGDIDNDGLNEVAMGTMQGSGYELSYYEYESGSWNEFYIEDNLGECDGIEIADIDQDGLNELVYAGMGGAYQVLSYYKFDSGIWTRFDILDPPTSWGIDTGDVDNDGKTEIAWGAYGAGAPQNEVRVYKLEETGWFEHIVSDVPGGWTDETHGTGIYHVAIGDLDNDGLNELAIGLHDTPTRPSEQTIRYYEFNSGSWIEYNVSDPDVSVEVVVIGDIDNDGENELLVGLDPTLFELRYYEIAG